MKTKFCYKCKTEKPIAEFNKDRSNKGGLQKRCRKCDNQYRREWFRKNPIKTWCSQTIRNHKTDDYIVDIKRDELMKMAIKTKKCPICGITLDYSFGTKNNKLWINSPSLDRINNEKFLNLDNIQIICRRCNATKLNRSMKEFVIYCAKIYNKFSMEYLL